MIINMISLLGCRWSENATREAENAGLDEARHADVVRRKACIMLCRCRKRQLKNVRQSWRGVVVRWTNRLTFHAHRKPSHQTIENHITRQPIALSNQHECRQTVPWPGLDMASLHMHYSSKRLGIVRQFPEDLFWKMAIRGFGAGMLVTYVALQWSNQSRRASSRGAWATALGRQIRMPERHFPNSAFRTSTFLRNDRTNATTRYWQQRQ